MTGPEPNMVQDQSCTLPTGRQASSETGNWIESMSIFGAYFFLDKGGKMDYHNHYTIGGYSILWNEKRKTFC
jgi:hypothetical protein